MHHCTRLFNLGMLKLSYFHPLPAARLGLRLSLGPYPTYRHLHHVNWQYMYVWRLIECISASNSLCSWPASCSTSKLHVGFLARDFQDYSYCYNFKLSTGTLAIVMHEGLLGGRAAGLKEKSVYSFFFSNLVSWWHYTFFEIYNPKGLESGTWTPSLSYPSSCLST